MSAIQRPRMTEEEYLLIERDAFEKSDFYQGEMYSMAGASRFHNTINSNLTGELHGRLKGTMCRQFANDMRVKNEVTGLYSYPDSLIVCEEPQFKDQFFDILLNPRVVFEVLSKSTESYDRGFKFESYRRLKSCQEYIIISQIKPLVERFVRQTDDTWLMTTFEGLDCEMELSSVPIRIPMKDLYADVKFEPVHVQAS